VFDRMIATCHFSRFAGGEKKALMGGLRTQLSAFSDAVEVSRGDIVTTISPKMCLPQCSEWDRVLSVRTHT
jgi:hypothetical protein